MGEKWTLKNVLTNQNSFNAKAPRGTKERRNKIFGNKSDEERARKQEIWGCKTKFLSKTKY